jgi:hypothetical protein
VLYALLCGGFIGGAGFIAGLAIARVTLIRVLLRRKLLKPVEQLTLVQTAGVLAFFTMRSYPENSAALYSVDLLVLLPAMLFIGEADRKLRHIVRRRVARPAANYHECEAAPAAGSQFANIGIAGGSRVVKRLEPVGPGMVLAGSRRFVE